MTLGCVGEVMGSLTQRSNINYTIVPLIDIESGIDELVKTSISMDK